MLRVFVRLGSRSLRSVSDLVSVLTGVGGTFWEVYQAVRDQKFVYWDHAWGHRVI